MSVFPKKPADDVPARHPLRQRIPMTAKLVALTGRSFARIGAICLLGMFGMAGAGVTQALAAPGDAPVHVPHADANGASIVPVLQRARDAARKKNYVGTFVVMSSSGATASSRIWHLSDGNQQVERMESLSGSPRHVLRRNDQVTTYLPDSHTARTEVRDTYGLFPHLPRVQETALGDYYRVRSKGSERVAGFDTEVFQLSARDGLRYGYRLWVERRTGFAVQLQTLDKTGAVLEQAAFSDLQFDVPLRADKMQQAIGSTAGYKVEKLERVRTSADVEGWLMRNAVPGFEPMDCYKKAADAPPGAVQWIFSDGLATVSLFIEPYGSRPRQEWRSAAGMTQMVGRRVAQDWWLTAMGEVPSQTLEAFAATLERRP